MALETSMDCVYSKILDSTAHRVKPQTITSVTNHTNSHQNQKRPQPTSHTPFASPPTLPIDDFHLLENPNKYSDDEKQLRIKLAAVYRLIELNGWAMGIYNHVTVSV